MSPVVAACVLCGWMVQDFPDQISWLNQFRGLIPHPSTGEIVLTGLGIQFDPGDLLLAPLDRHARGDQPGFENRNADIAEEFGQVYLRLKHDVIFHDSGWSLLIRYVPCDCFAHLLQNLYNVCRSLPFPLRGITLSWGHDYGGLVSIRNNEHYPWEDRYSDRTIHGPETRRYRADPLEASEALSIISAMPELPPDPESKYSNSVGQPSCPVTCHQDPLSVFPVEICCQICSYLPTVDFLNCRLASRALCPVFHHQPFWATRFSTDIKERSWLFEITNRRHDIVDWRSLYHQTRSSKLGPHLQNRKRVWNLFRRIPDYACLSWMEPPRFEPNTTFGCRVTGHLRPKPRRPNPHHGFEEGCRVFQSRIISAPSVIETIRAYLITFDDATYIAGLEFHCSGKDKVCVGYRTLDFEALSLDFQPQGMLVASGARGIQAIRFIGSGSLATKWLGHAVNCPKTERLLTYSKLNEIEVGFDGCKLVLLALPETDNSAKEATLRNMAYWYPDIPIASLFINEYQFPGKMELVDKYIPLSWVDFGAKNRLSHLTGISVTYHNGPEKIQFNYDALESLSLGRHEYNPEAKELHFSIDGPGGERMQSIEAYYFPDPNTIPSGSPWEGPLDGYLFWTFKVSTNRGRSKLFIPDSETLKSDLQSWQLTIEPGRTLTGLYAQQQFEFGRGFAGLGVVSMKTAD